MRSLMSSLRVVGRALLSAVSMEVKVEVLLNKVLMGDFAVFTKTSLHRTVDRLSVSMSEHISASVVESAHRVIDANGLELTESQFVADLHRRAPGSISESCLYDAFVETRKRIVEELLLEPSTINRAAVKELASTRLTARGPLGLSDLTLVIAGDPAVVAQLVEPLTSTLPFAVTEVHLEPLWGLGQMRIGYLRRNSILP